MALEKHAHSVGDEHVENRGEGGLLWTHLSGRREAGWRQGWEKPGLGR